MPDPYIGFHAAFNSLTPLIVVGLLFVAVIVVILFKRAER